MLATNNSNTILQSSQSVTNTYQMPLIITCVFLIPSFFCSFKGTRTFLDNKSRKNYMYVENLCADQCPQQLFL